MFVRFRDWLDRRLVPTWRVWWKLGSMRLGIVFAALITFLTQVPTALSAALNALPDWLRASLPVWVGPAVLALLFITRFWDQTHAAAAVLQDQKDKTDGPE